PAPSFRRFVPCFFRFARPLPTPALFPYTTLFRSVLAAASVLGAVALFLRGNLRGVWRIVVPVILLVLAVLLRVIDAKFWGVVAIDRKSTRLNSSHVKSSYAVVCLQEKVHSSMTAV